MLMRIYFDLEIYLKKKILLFVLRYQMLDTRIHRFKIKCLSIQKAFILMGNSAYKTLLFYVISMSKCRGNYRTPQEKGQAGSQQCVTTKCCGKEDLNRADQYFHKKKRKKKHLENLDRI